MSCKLEMTVSVLQFVINSLCSLTTGPAGAQTPEVHAGYQPRAVSTSVWPHGKVPHPSLPALLLPPVSELRPHPAVLDHPQHPLHPASTLQPPAP